MELEPTRHTGRRDCTTSLRIPPQKKQVIPVKMRLAYLQNHTRRALLLWVMSTAMTNRLGNVGDVLFHVYYPVEHGRGNPKAYEMKHLVVQRKRLREIGESQKP